MSKTALTKQIELDLFGYTKSGNAGIYGAYEVTFGAAYGDERVDYVTLKSNGEISCYEIKVSKFDFHSKAKLSFYGDYNYFVMPEELYEEVKSEIPWSIGVIVRKSSGLLAKARKAGKKTVPPWQPRKDEEYYFPAAGFQYSCSAAWYNSPIDFALKEAGMIFKTKAACEAALPELRKKYLGGDKNG